MSINDLIVQGAEPLFFLDYFATSHLDLRISNEVLKGIVDGCLESQCELIGGETAEMPGMYQDGWNFISFISFYFILLFYFHLSIISLISIDQLLIL